MTADDTFLEVGEDFIAHFGKKGMKWGHRSNKPSISSKKGSSSTKGDKTATLGLVAGIIGIRLALTLSARKVLNDNPDFLSEGQDFVVTHFSDLIV